MESKNALDAFAALAQKTRLAAFRLLVAAGADGLAAGEIARRLGVPASTMSVHLGVLERAGLAVSRRESRSILYAPDFEGMRALIGFLLEDCCQGRTKICAPVLDSLECLGAAKEVCQ